MTVGIGLVILIVPSNLIKDERPYAFMMLYDNDFSILGHGLEDVLIWKLKWSFKKLNFCTSAIAHVFHLPNGYQRELLSLILAGCSNTLAMKSLGSTPAFNFKIISSRCASFA